MKDKDKHPIKVLFIVPSLVRAGAEAQLVDLVNGLSNQQFEKHLFTFENNLDQKDRLDLENITLYNQPRRYKFDLAPVKRIAQIIDSEKIDVIHCTLLFSVLFSCMAKLFSNNKPPIIAAIHTTLHRSIKDEIKSRFLYRYLLARCPSGIIFVCWKQRDHWQKKYPSLIKVPTHIIYNGVNTDHFCATDRWQKAGLELRQQLAIPDNTLTITCIAGFRPEKGHLLLLDAFASLPHNSTTYLLLAGDGPGKQEIQNKIAEKQLHNRVILLGDVEDVRPLLAMSNLTILPSKAETFSMAMLESMAMEVPVLATDVGGSSEAVIPLETGFLVKANSVAALCQGLAAALDKPDELTGLGKTGRNIVLKQFGRNIMLNETAKVLLNPSATQGDENLRGCCNGQS